MKINVPSNTKTVILNTVSKKNDRTKKRGKRSEN